MILKKKIKQKKIKNNKKIKYRPRVTVIVKRKKIVIKKMVTDKGYKG